MTSTTAKYVPLVQYLNALPPEQTEATLTVAELEVLCGPLSGSARVYPHYWRGVSRSRYWQGSGWTTQLDFRSQTVTFRRQGDIRRD